jgi:hypothetical protein
MSVIISQSIFVMCVHSYIMRTLRFWDCGFLHYFVLVQKLSADHEEVLLIEWTFRSFLKHRRRSSESGANTKTEINKNKKQNCNPCMISAYCRASRLCQRSCLQSRRCCAPPYFRLHGIYFKVKKSKLLNINWFWEFNFILETANICKCEEILNPTDVLLKIISYVNHRKNINYFWEGLNTTPAFRQMLHLYVGATNNSKVVIIQFSDT